MRNYVKILNNKIIFKIIPIILGIVLFAMPHFSYASSIYGNIEFEAISNSNSKPVDGLEVTIFLIGYNNSENKYVLNPEITAYLKENETDELYNKIIDIDIRTFKEEEISIIASSIKSIKDADFTETTNSNGKFELKNVDTGIYLFIQNNLFETCKMQNTLAIVRNNETSKVSPKIVNIIKHKTLIKKKPIEKVEEQNIEEELLPYTGVLNWPIPVLSVLGVVTFSIGWYMAFKNKKTNRKGIITIILSSFMIIASGTILIYNNSEDKQVLQENLANVQNLEKEIEKNKAQNLNERIESYNELEDFERSSDYIQIDDKSYIGILYVPSLDNLSIPILKECSTSNLKKSVCRYSGNLGNNLVIAGHNYKSIFGKLLNINNLNETVYVKDIYGTINKYNLKKIDELNPKETAKMKNEKYDLTLFTCTYSGNKRKTLRFVLD